jgi:osmotically-inducible protein OsmY
MKQITTIILTVALVGCVSTRPRSLEVRERLSQTSGLATHNISIDEDRHGYIVLNGSVSSPDDRATIENVARNTSGVREVRSNLVVESSSVSVGYNSNNQNSIVSDITSRISSSPVLRDYKVNVESVGSAVTLRGAVGNDRERYEAERIARSTSGVSSVRNELTVARSTRRDFLDSSRSVYR